MWFVVWNSVCWNDGSVKIVAGPSDHQGKGFSRTDNNLAGQGPRSGAYFEDCDNAVTAQWGLLKCHKDAVRTQRGRI